MKKLLTIMMALVMIVTLSQCRRPNEENEDNTAKVRISCTIPINNDGKTDFNNILTDGTIKWSKGIEKIYLAIPDMNGDDNHQLVELVGENSGEASVNKLTFMGVVNSDVLDLFVEDKSYDVWYFGHSHQLQTPYYSYNSENNVLTGSIATQSGDLKDLGYYHIAKAKVTYRVRENNGVPVYTLSFNEDGFQNQISIAKLDMEGRTNLGGNAIMGTEYSLQYVPEKGSYDLVVTGDNNIINITKESGRSDSYVVMLSNASPRVELKSDKNEKKHKILFKEGLKPSILYKENDGSSLVWEEATMIDGYEYIDLGLPSGLKWASCNIGSQSPEKKGNYYAWGDIVPYENATFATDGKELKNNISGNPDLDAATANMKGVDGKSRWRIPAEADINELLENCMLERVNVNNISGFNVVSKINGKHIFLPIVGRMWKGEFYENSHYWRAEPRTVNNHTWANSIYLGNNDIDINSGGGMRINGYNIRPVSNGSEVTYQLQNPWIETEKVTIIDGENVKLDGRLISDNGCPVTEIGFCWNTSPNPTTADSKISKQGTFTTEESYSFNANNLDAGGVTYYARAYAKNELGTFYGEELSFVTTSQGYVDFGDVSWSKYNLHKITEHYYPTEAELGARFHWGEVVPYHSFDNDDNYHDDNYCSNDKSYGNMMADISGNINFDAATYLWGQGWRMPTKDEFEYLFTNCNPEWTYRKLNESVTVYGYEFKPNNNNRIINSIFLPVDPATAGYGPVENAYGRYWTSTAVEGSGTKAYIIKFYKEREGKKYEFVEEDRHTNNTITIRPIYDINHTPAQQYVWVKTLGHDEIMNHTALLKAEVTAKNGSEVYLRGFHVTDVNGEDVIEAYDYHDNGQYDSDVYQCHVQGLNRGTRYYYKAFVVNEAGINYGEQKEFVTTDNDQHSYVDLGLASGTLWAMYNVGTDNSLEVGGYYQSDCDLAKEGWSGWEIPTRAQWEEMIDACEWFWAVNEGVRVHVGFSRKSSGIIMLPAGGYYDHGTLGEGSHGWCNSNGGSESGNYSRPFYWTSTEETYNTSHYTLEESIKNGKALGVLDVDNIKYNYQGLNIRAVKKK